MEKILSFDPASRTTLGYAVICKHPKRIEYSGYTTVIKGETDAKRLADVFVFVSQLIETVQPTVIVIERTISFAGSFITGQISQNTGVILCAIGNRQTDIPIEYVYPTSVKKSLTGSGKASKADMKKVVAEYVPNISKLSEHAIDALANGIYFLKNSENKKGGSAKKEES